MEQLKTESQRQYDYMEQMKSWVAKKSQELGRPLTCHCTTFGCQMNEKDSEKLLGILETIGYQEVDTEEADLLLFNTCTVRENANTKLYGHLGQVKKMKERNPHMMIGLCGCMMQEPHVIEKIQKSYRFVDIVFGTYNIFKLAQLLKARVDSGSMIVDIWKDTNEIVEDLPSDRKFSFKCGVNIMYGCNNFCSYCIVPYVRGRERSRKPEDIIKEVTQVVSEGVKEVMLLGQNVNSYGKTLEEPMSFADLLREVEKVPGLERIRFMTPHPKDLSDDLIDVMAHSKKVCSHMHLPMQSGSTRLLKAMNRHYTKEQYLELAKKIKERIPGVSFTTDIIVGFPGETEEDFEETLDVVRKVGFDSAYTYIYSKRTGTPAASMENQVDKDVIKDRFDRLLAVLKETSEQNCKKKVGQIERVLIEEVNTHEEGMVTGRLENNLLVHFKGCKEQIGTMADVKLVEEKGFYYMGEQVNG
ncbi:tRNA (N6-isopentenyl adenosine(37)-C2)-methylthiotransferase MiaB [Anaerostipes sp. MSJ-23]|uniref:tRNA (N6-isopentenyl adenosine(37)-C2)-methylthiotransferase MiaB n=1 Tax=unclassified Anaerostipes TaxID=2635253 RepID=UPI001C10ECAC|nr:tRNA (N6-isopentenyl adenosine(37)-C2)-methylthiotransferase MiaB [Anaerostipes sp. MSJ-23]MBU5458986.1 tRNA (N6-isopentenyl adenosine(37)-C2)-methylthiotransferase MiaB [Anaerostipes sp. MSJ-23]